MNKIFSITKLEKFVKNTFFRFFISSIILFFVTWIFLYLIYIDKFTFKENLFLLNISLLVTFFVSVWFYIFWESKKISKSTNELLQIFPILYWVLFYHSFNSEYFYFENIIFIFLNLVGILSLIFFSPFLYKIFTKKELDLKIEQNNYYSYFSSVLSIVFSSILIALVVFLLWSTLFFSVDHLFDINISSKIYAYIFIISSCFIAPFYAINHFPAKESFENTSVNERKFSVFLIKYIYIPFIFSYFVLLYAYSIKVLANFEFWPKWEISWLVLSFSIFWYFIYLTSYMYEEKFSIVKLFRKYFPFVLIPQIFMLFYAIFLRINQYWLTINRYLLLVFWIYLLVISLYYIFSKRKYLMMILVWLFSFTFVISIWPWSIYNLPKSIQIEALKLELQDIWILTKNGDIKALSSEEKVKEENNKKIDSINSRLSYICEYHSCIDLLKVLTNWKQKDFISTNKEYFDYFTILNDFKEYLNINRNYIEEKFPTYINLSFYTSKNHFVKISSFDYLTEFSNNFNEWSKNFAYLDLSKKSLNIYEDWKKIINIDISLILDRIIETKNLSWKQDDYLIFELENDKVKAKILVQQVDVFLKDWKILLANPNENLYNSITWFLLYTKK